MSAGIIYRINFQNFDNDYVRVDIADTSVQIGPYTDPEIRTLTGTGNPLTIRVIDNSEEKFTPIRAKQATIEFRSEVGFNIGTFADGPDNRFQVTCYLNPSTVNLVIFNGYLVTSDLEQLFLPNPQVVVLTASDQLGLLKDTPYTNDTGIYPQGKFKIAQYIANALKKTGLRQTIKVVNNLKAGGGQFAGDAAFLSGSNTMLTDQTPFFYPGQRIRVSQSTFNNGEYIVQGVGVIVGTAVVLDANLINEPANPVVIEDISSETHIYDTVYLDARTFEQGINASEDCYEVLEKILGDDCSLTQHNGEWWITRIDEYDQNSMYVAEFDPDGNYVETVEIDLSKRVGATEAVRFANADNLLRLDRPKAFITETFRFIYPVELICNQDFSRGDAIIPPDFTQASGTATYELDCWELKRLFGQPITSTAYIKREFDFTYEKNRYAVITPKTDSGATPWDFIQSSPVPVKSRYKAQVNFNYRWEDELGSGGMVTHYPIRIWLVDKSGRYWHWWNPSSANPADFYWMNPSTNGTSPTQQDEKSVPDAFILNDYHNLMDESGNPDYKNQGWRQISLDLGTIPTDGDLYIGLNQLRQGSSSGNDNQPAFFRGLSLSLTPFINGTYEQYSGYQYNVKRTEEGYKAIRENDVYLGEPPVENMKGAMFILAGPSFRLINKFYPSAPFALGPPPDQSVVNTFGYLQAFAVWNQNRNTLRKFSGTLLHLGEGHGDIIHKFRLTDGNPNTDERYFLLISFEQNWRSCQTAANFIEVFRFDGKVYTDPWSFKYLTQ